MKVLLSAIERDASIQCRESIDIGVVNDYAERMEAGDAFPPAVLFGTKDKAWIGDGWHRVMAAESFGAKTIEADLKLGGRIEALKYALSANTLHGNRRTNADKRKCVEIALKEFPKMSDRAIAQMCGIDDKTVAVYRMPRMSTCGNSAPDPGPQTRVGIDGKTYTIKPRTKASPEVDAVPARRKGADIPTCVGLQFARMAILDLEQIDKKDTERVEAFKLVRTWLNDNE
jgi:hypothetical protein